MPDIVKYFDGTDPVQVDVTGLLDQVVGVLPYILPTIVGFIAVRKAIGFVKGMLQGA